MGLRSRIFRLKNLPPGELATPLRRCLTTFDITLLGIGHMIGAGIYVLTGSVVRNTAGPSIIVSFLLAGFASLLSALCYAEFGARFPKAGSAYTYTYVGIGEIWAFIIGWNIILEHMLGAAAVARSWSGYLDSLLGNVISNGTIAKMGHLHQTSSFFGDYPDLLAFLLIVIVAFFVALGSKVSTNFNSFLTILNIGVVVVVVFYGATFADFSLWTGTDQNGNSRFLPYGVSGMFAGAASCFFAYIGFDGLATAGEEAEDPKKSIPIATFWSMTVVTLAYVLMAASLTLMVPYDSVHPTAAFSDAFQMRGATFAANLVSLGAIFGMTTSLVGGMFALPRCVFAMADDGLLFRSLAEINPNTRVPCFALVVFGFLTAIIALLFDITTLVEFLSIGTLLAYSIVSACVIVLRYQPAFNPDEAQFDNGGKLRFSVPIFGKWLKNLEPGHSIYYGMSLMVGTMFLASFAFSQSYLHSSLPAQIFLTVNCILVIFSFLFICAHYQNSTPLDFKVPLVPLVPSLSLLVNILMMVHLTWITWLRLVIWMTLGFGIYFGYGIRNSKEESKNGNLADLSKSSTYESVVSAS